MTDEKEMNIQDIINLAPTAFQAEKAAGIDTRILIHLTGDRGGDWSVVIQNQKLNVQPGAISDPKITVMADAQDCLNIFTGKLDGVKAFMQGKIKIQGDMSMAMKMTSLFKM